MNVLIKCKQECSICAYHYIFLKTCKYHNCSYKICNRCLFLYARKKCPACTRENAFVETKNLKKCCNEIIGQYKVFFISLYYCFLSIVIFHVFCLIGVVVGLLLYPYSCCRSYEDFVLFGLFGFSLLICGIIIFLCACCKDSED